MRLHRFSFLEVRHVPTLPNIFSNTFGPVPATQFSKFSKFSTRDRMPYHVHIFIQNFKSFAHHHHPSSIFGTPTPLIFRPTYFRTGLSDPIFNFSQMFDWGSYAPPFPLVHAHCRASCLSSSPPTILWPDVSARSYTRFKVFGHLVARCVHIFHSTFRISLSPTIFKSTSIQHSLPLQ